MTHTAVLVGHLFDKWGFVPLIVRDAFPDASPAGVASALDGFCRQHLGAGVAASEFFYVSIGSVHGLRLLDDRRVVVKVHSRRMSVRFLEAVQAVQRRLFEQGFPAPEPLVGPVAIGRGTAVAEALIDEGDHADAHNPEIRRMMATSLASLVELCRPLRRLEGLRENIMVLENEDQLWPVPHDRRFDFEATTPGAEWIDRIATKARQLREREVGQVVVAHTDWRVQNMRFVDGRLTAVYDWDSLGIGLEPVLVGSIAHAFTSNWAAFDWEHFPSLEEALSFIDEYQDARGSRFSADERAVALASLAYTMAYTARCEHSDALTDIGLPPSVFRPPTAVPAGSARAFLATHANALLGIDVGPTPDILQPDTAPAPAPEQEGTSKAVVVVNEIEGGTQDFYEQVSERVTPGGQLPEGCQLHIAGPTGRGWRVITVWDSEEKFQQFRNEKLIPTMREVGGEDRVAPKVEANPVHRLVTA